MRLPSSTPHPALSAWAAVLLSLWLIALWAGPAMLAALEASAGIALNPHGHAHLYAHGHPFVDARALLGLPNAMDVLSNAPIALAGLWGLLVLRRTPRPAQRDWPRRCSSSACCSPASARPGTTGRPTRMACSGTAWAWP